MAIKPKKSRKTSARPRKKSAPRWRRRKESRPAEILDAALTIFAEQGFARARLDDIAARAEVAKGSLYLYFDTKEELFRAMVAARLAPNLAAIEEAAKGMEAPLAVILPALLAQAARVVSQPHLAGLARMVIGESRAFPDLARVWHDDIVARMLSLLAGLLAAAQKRGEIRADLDPRLAAFSVMGPLVMAALFGEVFADVASDPPDLARLAAQHAQILLKGFLVQKGD